MLKITTTQKGYKLVFTISVNGKRHRIKRLFSSFLQCKNVALSLGKRLNRTLLVYVEAEMRYKVYGM